MNGIGEELKKGYESLFSEYRLEPPLDAGNISLVIKQFLRDFLEHAKNPGIYCNGGHTKMLMADFMYELKKVRYIIDNYAESEEENGFILLKDQGNTIEENGIDAVILSSYKFRKELKQSLKEKHPTLLVLDIYDELEKQGIKVQADYYYSNHPYQHYKEINRLQREIRNAVDKQTQQVLYLELITKYLHIKDFRTAAVKLREWKGEWEKNGYSEQEDERTAEDMLSRIESLYELQKKAAASLSGNHVLMFCLDGLRHSDLSEKDMPKMERLIKETGYRYTNAYSYSTSTFEGLVPVYSENSDFRTRYYEKNYVESGCCRFVSEAESQDREIYVYGDGEHYVEGRKIHYRQQFMTVTEKLWQFILDACEAEPGLFYVHELYESHFTFSNPYTEEVLMSEGTAMLFDFLPVKGGHLRADYARQHKDAIRYLDDVLEPMLRPMSCRMVLYADHGNLVLDYDTKLQEIGDLEYTCSEGWTRIPFVLRSPEMGAGTDDGLISLMELNNMILCLLSKQTYRRPDMDYIKIGRSELYNPDFRYLYKMIGKETYLQAFECFLFTDGCRMIVYADGTVQVYDGNGQPMEDVCGKEAMFGKIRSRITVCDLETIRKGWIFQ